MSKIMYRSESSYGSGVRDIIDIMVYEICELHNTDILDYVDWHYLHGELKNTVTQLMYATDEETDEFSEDDVRDICKEIIKAVNKKTGHDLKNALWLAEKSVVEDMYADDPLDIDAYYTSDVILSDLGSDGILFAYGDYPEPIE